MADEKVNKKTKKKEPNRVATWFKNFFSELKKVTWPSFATVLKQTGVVLMVTVCFLLVMIAFDSLFGLMYNALISGLNSGTEAVMANAVSGIGTIGRSLF